MGPAGPFRGDPGPRQFLGGPPAEDRFRDNRNSFQGPHPTAERPRPRPLFDTDFGSGPPFMPDQQFPQGGPGPGGFGPGPGPGMRPGPGMGPGPGFDRRNPIDPAGFDPESPAGRRLAMEQQQERLRREEQMRPRGNAADDRLQQGNSGFYGVDGGDGGFRNADRPPEDHFAFEEYDRRRSR